MAHPITSTPPASHLSTPSHGELKSNDERDPTRTPSPTPSEQAVLSRDRRLRLADLLKPKILRRLIIVTIFLVFVILLFALKDRIVDALKPAAKWMHDRPGGFLIPIAVMILLSFPPLIGHEVIIILIGFTWGLGIGFAITAAGTILGELVVYVIFRLLCVARSHRAEEASISYACLARTVREGGLLIAVVTRYAAIPSHVTTALFSVCGMTLTNFLIAAVVALPKQFAVLYIGYAFSLPSNQGTKIHSTVEGISISVTVVVTLVASWHIRKKQEAVKAAVVYERRKRRQTRLVLALSPVLESIPSSVESGRYASYPPAAWGEPSSQSHGP